MSTTDTATDGIDSPQDVRSLLEAEGFHAQLDDRGIDAVPGTGTNVHGTFVVTAREMEARAQLDGYQYRLRVNTEDGDHTSVHKTWTALGQRLEELL